jgi:hypothetical protein
MPQKIIPVRFDPQLFEVVAWASTIDGVSISSFCAGGAVARALFTVAREDPAHVADWNDLYPQVQRLVNNVNQRVDN